CLRHLRRLPDATDPLFDRQSHRRATKHPRSLSAVRCLAVHGRAVRSDEPRWHACALLCRASPRHAVEWAESNLALCLWRLPAFADAELLGLYWPALARPGWRLCARKHPWRRRVWPRMARRGPEDAPPSHL